VREGDVVVHEFGASDGLLDPASSNLVAQFGRIDEGAKGIGNPIKSSILQRRRYLMKKRLVLAMVLLSVGPVHDAVLAGSLEPPAPMMKTFQRSEPRTPIRGSGRVTIAAPGSYYLTANINVAGTTAVIITASNVTLDLNGFTIAGNLDNFGVVMGGNALNVVVRNGTIRNFAQGILNTGVTIVSLSHLTITENLRNGVAFDSDGIGVFIDGCTIDRNQQDGIVALGSLMVITNSTVVSNGHDGIELSGSANVVIRGNRVDDNGGSGIHAAIHFEGDSAPSGTILDNVLLHNGRFGIETSSAAGTFPDLSIARNFATSNTLGNYTLTGANAAPVVALASDPGAWANVQ
jgi:parallel beta-helix repeat protein